MARVPKSCADLDLGLVERVLAKHFGGISAAARELGVSSTDLRRLTWAEPRLLESAHELCGDVVTRAMDELISALDSPSDRRREWAAGRILSSYLAKDDPLAPAPRRAMGVQGGGAVKMSFKWKES